MNWDRARTVEVPGGRIEYFEEGDGPAVVLLHGLLMNHTYWNEAMPLLPTGFRYIRPVLPIGGHRTPMDDAADLSLDGLVRIVASFLEALDLDDVTLVHNDWGGALFLTARGLDDRVGRIVITPCEAFENFPPGLPGRMAATAARLPGGLSFAIWQMRIGWLRRLPILWGQMAKRPITREMMHGWTQHARADERIRRDTLKYGLEKFDKPKLRRDTEALRNFTGQALVLWSPENRAMPRRHGRELADLLPNGSLVEVPDTYALSALDDPPAVARHIGAFLLESTGEPTS